MTWMQDMPRYTITYCKYGFPYMKPTDIWTNHPNPKFKSPCKSGSKTGLQGIKGAEARSMYPKELCEHIVKICEEYI